MSKYSQTLLLACTIALLTCCSPEARAQESGDDVVPVPPPAHALDEPLVEVPMLLESPRLGELEFLAIDIARRSVMAHYPCAGKHPIRTLEVRVRPAGDIVHMFAKVEWSYSHFFSGKHLKEAEVFATLVYTPEVRRMIDISYKDNCLTAHRMFNRTVDLVSKFNEEFERRDPLRMNAPLVGPRPDIMAPRNVEWSLHPTSGDHAWHVNAADDHVRRGWRSVENRSTAR